MAREYVMMRTGPYEHSDIVATVHEDGYVRPLVHDLRHSLDGFAMGYGGSGPSELARCILLDHLGMPPSRPLYFSFRDRFLVPATGPELRISADEIAAFMDAWRAGDPESEIIEAVP